MKASLRELLSGYAEVPAALERNVTGVCMDSRQVRAGDLFLACAGTRAHGGAFVEDAIHRGAIAVAVEAHAGAKADAVQLPERVVPVIAVPDLRARAGFIAARSFGDPSSQLRVVGVTGTNGKTSVTQFIARVMSADAPAGIVGTLGSGLVGRLETTGHTTPDAVSVQETLAEMRRAGAQAVAMEVSSHGLHQGRVNGVHFEVGVFTNLTHEHLDYHGDMESYAAAKRLLFDMPGLKSIVINVDDATGRAWRSELSPTQRVISFGLDAVHAPEILGRELVLTPDGLRLTIATPVMETTVTSPLIGRFNASNLLAAFGALLALGMEPDQAAYRLSQLRAVPGRMERFGGGSGRPTALVDYAHTPDALEQVLSAARAHTQGRLVCVFGCGGNRDRAKRPVMGKVAERLADAVILTDDNPRLEDPDFIVEEITRGMERPDQALVIRDRARAIAYALGAAREGDVVLVAGKGHETTQQIGDTYLPFSDRAEVAHFFGEEVPHE